jgi:hypothetical protein
MGGTGGRYRGGIYKERRGGEIDCPEDSGEEYRREEEGRDRVF